MASTRYILIVEDDEDTRNFLVDFCKDATKELLKDGLDVELKITTATTYEQAIGVLQTMPVDFASLDLTLQFEAKKKYHSDSDRKAGKDPGGMRILKDMQEMQKQPVVLVMSGETLLSFATEALQRYGVFAYFQKSKDEVNFKPAVLSILWYLEAATLVSKIESQAEYDIISLAEKYWVNARSIAANIGIVHFPSNLDSRIADIKSKLDTVAKVPGTTWTELILRERVLGKNNWSLIKYQISNYKAFSSSQASQIGPLLAYMTNVAKGKCNEFGFPLAYVGIWGYEELTGPCILAVFNQNTTMIGKIADMTIEDIQDKSKFFQYAFDSATIRPEFTFTLWNGADNEGEFSDWHQLVDALSKTFK